MTEHIENLARKCGATDENVEHNEYFQAARNIHDQISKWFD